MPYIKRGFWSKFGHQTLKGVKIVGTGVGRGMGLLGRVGGGIGGYYAGLHWGRPYAGAIGGWHAGAAVGDGIASQFKGAPTGADQISKIIRAEYKSAKHFFKPRDFQPNPPGQYEYLNNPRPQRARGGGH
jgi:hypothetical protein